MRIKPGASRVVHAFRSAVVFLSCILSCSYDVAAQVSSAESRRVLETVRRRISADLERLPDYTCLETLDRSVYQPPERQLFVSDRVRFEVAFIGMKEIFSWPGAAEFQFSSMDEMIAKGVSASGFFGGWTHSIFRSPSAAFAFVGERSVAGHRTLGFNAGVPVSSSSFTVGFQGREVLVPYSATVWIDPDLQSPVQLDIRTEKIDLPIESVNIVIQYAPMRAGAGEFLLPQSATATMIDLAGHEHVISSTLTNCRQYLAQSHVSFDTPSTAEPVPSGSARGGSLPAGVTLETRLETPFDFERSAVGDPVTARLSQAAKAGRLRLPKGSVLSGRIRRLEHISRPDHYFVVGLEFFSMDLGGRRVTMRARLVGPELRVERIKDSSFYGSTPEDRGLRASGLDIDTLSAPSGVGTFRVWARTLHLKRGLRMIWETVAQ